MGSIQRKIKREKEKKRRKSLRKDLKQKLQLNRTIPSGCSVCDIRFDNGDKESIDSWFMEINGPTQVISLYCPSCHES